MLKYVGQYNKIPSFDEIELDAKKYIPEQKLEEVLNQIKIVKAEEKDIIFQKMIKDTEDYFKGVAVQNAVIKCATMIDAQKVSEYNSFPEILKKGLAVSFDNHIGIDFNDDEDIETRYKAYVTRPDKIELGTKLFNLVTDGGYEKKTVNVYIAPTNVGKTWKLVDDAAHLYKHGYNILYITLEMSEEKIMQRIETNLFEVPTKKFKELTFDEYKNHFKNLKSNINRKFGKLITHEYPTSSANIGHFNALLDELQLKKDFIPDVVIVDYIAIMAPLEQGYGGMYEKMKFVVEELRRFAVERNVCVITAVQTNRTGYSVSDFDLTSTAESMSIAHVSDFICAIIRDDDLDEVNEIWVKVLKNRYEPIKNKKFNLGSNIHIQKFFDVNQENDSDFTPEKIVEDNNKIKKDFSGFKYD